ncbi:hypothetical protein BT96DRAFT_1010184 [Gymnopus androsaceus JB14]|uniref:Uncharacterized protein n=1 Tax=Gymnopus androsaceus JB14 TaxID=1447944 RepID=A0A6A4GB48_9AGAR|nr:hypothetical protein BT96DRAFT_1010184 [Gymnopus androsaceus JB14]
MSTRSEALNGLRASFLVNITAMDRDILVPAVISYDDAITFVVWSCGHVYWEVTSHRTARRRMIQIRAEMVLPPSDYSSNPKIFGHLLPFLGSRFIVSHSGKLIQPIYRGIRPGYFVQQARSDATGDLVIADFTKFIPSLLNLISSVIRRTRLPAEGLLCFLALTSLALLQCNLSLPDNKSCSNIS